MANRQICEYEINNKVNNYIYNNKNIPKMHLKHEMQLQKLKLCKNFEFLYILK